MGRLSSIRDAVTMRLGFVALLIVAGCSNQSFQTADVTGTVTYLGKPAVGVWLEFAPPDGHRRKLPSAVGVTDASGRYRMVLPGRRYGAVVGTNRVTVSVMEGEGGDVTKIPGDVLSRAAGDVTVAAGGTVHDIAL
jgi:hypothetical protein